MEEFDTKYLLLGITYLQIIAHYGNNYLLLVKSIESMLCQSTISLRKLS